MKTNEPSSNTCQLKKIDELIAVEVMGLDVCKCTVPRCAFGHKERCFNCNKDVANSYTTDMNQAIEALLKSEVMTIQIHSDTDMVFLDGEYFGQYETVEELACLLCKAILKDMGISYEL